MAKKRSYQLVNLLYKLRAEVVMDDDKYYFILMAISCPVVFAIKRTTKHNVQTMFSLLEKKNILRKS